MKTCPRCSRAGDTQEDIQAGCVDKQTLGCPDPRDVIPGKDIVLKCRDELCGKQVAIPAASVMHRTIPTEISCMRSPCQAVAFQAPVAPQTEADMLKPEVKTRGKNPKK